MSDDLGQRSFEPIRRIHLARLSEIATLDRERFLERRPEYRRRLLVVVLAQGAALHYVDKTTGVKDLDVWSFFAAIRGEPFPANRRETHADFGSSSLGRQVYKDRGVSPSRRAQFRRWERFEGRRVDLLMRALPVSARADPTEAIRDWLARGADTRRQPRPSSWYLAQKAAVIIDPKDRRGQIVWPPPRSSP